MGATTEQVIQALKADCIPNLRKAGFKGSFPNFYRVSDEFIALINFQFFSSGGSLCVNISYAGRERKNVYFRPETEPKKLKVSQTNVRRRLGAEADNSDRWFSFGSTSYGAHRGAPSPLKELTSTLNDLFASDAEPWWNSKQFSS